MLWFLLISFMFSLTFFLGHFVVSASAQFTCDSRSCASAPVARRRRKPQHLKCSCGNAPTPMQLRHQQRSPNRRFTDTSGTRRAMHSHPVSLFLSARPSCWPINHLKMPAVFSVLIFAQSMYPCSDGFRHAYALL